MTIALSETQTEALTVCEGELPSNVAHSFAIKHGLDSGTEQLLLYQIEQSLS